MPECRSPRIDIFTICFSSVFSVRSFGDGIDCGCGLFSVVLVSVIVIAALLSLNNALISFNWNLFNCSIETSTRLLNINTKDFLDSIFLKAEDLRLLLFVIILLML